MPEQIDLARGPDIVPARGHHLTVAGQLGRGSTAKIYRAEDRRLHRAVAMKRLDEELARRSEIRDGFLAEAQITGQLEHPNVVPVHEIGETDDGVPYFTMKVVSGITFEQWLRDPAHPVGSGARVQQGIEILLQVCDALVYAHGRGVIHRDVKPENVMVGDDGRAYLIDWGLARLCGAHRVETDPPRHDYIGVAGTPGYMSPEQAGGNPLRMDHRCDVFGVGAMLYEILSGCGPYGRSTDGTTLLLRAWHGDVVPIEQAVQGGTASPQLLELVRKAVAADSGDRHQSVRELAQRLRALLDRGDCFPNVVFQPGHVICGRLRVGGRPYLVARARRRVTRAVDRRARAVGTLRAGQIVGTAVVVGARRVARADAIDRAAALARDRACVSTSLDLEGRLGIRAAAEPQTPLELTRFRSQPDALWKRLRGVVGRLVMRTCLRYFGPPSASGARPA